MKTIKILTRYSVGDPIQYSNTSLYFYFYENGDLYSVAGDFGKPVECYQMNEDQFLKTDSDIRCKEYCLLFPDGRKINFIESKDEAEQLKNKFNKLI